ncbi:HNH endonuclease [Paenibacillus sp. FSL P4-0081]|uniref:HNH endonuclease n=1 Tax=Paenibacillus sp. FSL P4-0081 TaxID=1536769 RepID=UPI0004F802E0|nr:HNH endonuclease signature motif containing protein [Paenibacillus sp. FSL P4-0081]AIQ31649.1 HNH endonuclease [Paenibacillus sp. FSL P4-0081]
MPSRPKRPCNKAGCRELVSNGGYCDKHRQQREQHRGTSASRGYGHKWKKERLEYLKLHPLCVVCKASGVAGAATVVDHIIPHKGDDKLFWRRSNWQPLCASHHSQKTAKEDGGFGNKIVF